MKNNIAQIREEINAGQHQNLATTLRKKGIDLDAIVAAESSNMLEVSRRMNLGLITNPLPKAIDIPYGFAANQDVAHRGIWTAKVGKYQGLRLIGSIAIYDDLAWYHVSFSRPDRIPSYKDITMIKDVWFGKDRWAIQVHPKADEHVNIAPTCLHLWSCLEGFNLPDFRCFGVN